MKKFEVYVPCIYSEIYLVEAPDEETAMQMVRDQDAQCIGESITGKESTGRYWARCVSDGKKTEK